MTQSLLSRIQPTRTMRPPRMILYGPHGIGKSTFGAQAPNPIFIRIEDGLDALDTQAFPPATSLEEVESYLGALAREQHNFQTLVVDSLDWLEQLIWKAVCIADGVSNIELVGKGFGKGYVIALKRWERLLDLMEALRNTRNMGIILLGHAKVKRFDDPTTEPYDRYSLDIQEKAANLVEEAVDIVGFATYRVNVSTITTGFNQTVRRGVGGTDRVMYLHERPGFRAKTRFPLPPELPLSWGAFQAAFVAAMQPPAAQPQPAPSIPMPALSAPEPSTPVPTQQPAWATRK